MNRIPVIGFRDINSIEHVVFVNHIVCLTAESPETTIIWTANGEEPITIGLEIQEVFEKINSAYLNG